jgi:hypothetical protein
VAALCLGTSIPVSFIFCEGLNAYLLIHSSHVLLRMPSLYFNRVGRVFTEADFSEMELSILLRRGKHKPVVFLFVTPAKLVVAAQEGPNSITARIIDHRSLLRGYGGLRGVDNEENEPLISQYPTPYT